MFGRHLRACFLIPIALSLGSASSQDSGRCDWVDELEWGEEEAEQSEAQTGPTQKGATQKGARIPTDDIGELCSTANTSLHEKLCCCKGTGVAVKGRRIRGKRGLLVWCLGEKTCKAASQCSQPSKTGTKDDRFLAGCYCTWDCVMQGACCPECKTTCTAEAEKRGITVSKTSCKDRCAKKNQAGKCSCHSSCTIKGTCCQDDPATPRVQEGYMAQCSAFRKRFDELNVDKRGDISLLDLDHSLRKSTAGSSECCPCKYARSFMDLSKRLSQHRKDYTGSASSQGKLGRLEITPENLEALCTLPVLGKQAQSFTEDELEIIYMMCSHLIGASIRQREVGKTGSRLIHTYKKLQKKGLCLPLQCLDHRGKPVAHWVILRIPAKNFPTPRRRPQSYAYIDETGEGLTLHQNLDAVKSPVSQTIAQLQFGQPNATWTGIVYNDQPPRALWKGHPYGHMKGILAWRNGRGFWLVHSLPRFPDLEGDIWSQASVQEGQSFACVELDRQGFDMVAEQVFAAHPAKMVAHNAAKFKHPFSIWAGDRPPPTPSWGKLTERFELNDRYDFFARGPDQKTLMQQTDIWASVEEVLLGQADIWEKLDPMQVFQYDIWSDIARLAEVKLTVQARQSIPSRDCDIDNDVRVDNVLGTGIREEEVFWGSIVDHSKWAFNFLENEINFNNNTLGNDRDCGVEEPLFCVGDLDRDLAFRKPRGGTVLCFKEPAIHEAFCQASVSMCGGPPMPEALGHLLEGNYEAAARSAAFTVMEEED